ncbi:laccase domain-containing protein [Lachnobacterium bovis]|uniref:laccase domain-containing protein n=1 Tax=Lachnobacterium bovis TaxID=140626 RepID=UPI00048FBC3D|nr:laccase domain-containing protein [Lachnobacterium bovis]
MKPGTCSIDFFMQIVCHLYFVDTKNKAIGLSHSGWRGTVKRMGQVTLEKMAKEFGTDPKDVICAIGSIFYVLINLIPKLFVSTK